MHRKFEWSILSICLYIFGCEGKQKFIENYQELMREDLISKGWVPNEIPRDFMNLDLRYDLDVNKGCGKYSFKNKPFLLEQETGKRLNEIDKTSLLSSILDKYCPEGSEDFLKSNAILLDGFVFFENQEKKSAYFLILK